MDFGCSPFHQSFLHVHGAIFRVICLKVEISVLQNIRDRTRSVGWKIEHQGKRKIKIKITMMKRRQHSWKLALLECR